MSILALKDSLALRKAGSVLGRASLSEEVIRCVAEFNSGTKVPLRELIREKCDKVEVDSYVAAMILAGRLKAIAQAARFDDYWSEKVGIGYQWELDRLLLIARKSATLKPEVAHA